MNSAEIGDDLPLIEADEDHPLVSLWQAVTWIALNDFDATVPYDFQLDESSAEHLKLTQRRLLAALAHGHLAALGRTQKASAPASLGWSKIPAPFWNSREPSWRDSRLEILSGKEFFEDILLKRSDVLRLWPPQAQPALAVSPEPETAPASPVEYETPYMRLMQTAIRRFDIRIDNQPKAAVLRDWLKQQIIDGEHVSGNLAEAMATMLRMPDRRKGGHYSPAGPDPDT